MKSKMMSYRTKVPKFYNFVFKYILANLAKFYFLAYQFSYKNLSIKH